MEFEESCHDVTTRWQTFFPSSCSLPCPSPSITDEINSSFLMFLFLSPDRAPRHPVRSYGTRVRHLLVSSHNRKSHLTSFEENTIFLFPFSTDISAESLQSTEDDIKAAAAINKMNSLKQNENEYENMEEENRIKLNHGAHLIPFIILLTKPLTLESKMLNCGFRVQIYCGPLVTSTGVKRLVEVFMTPTPDKCSHSW